MLKILIKKQMGEIFRQYFYNPKKNQARSKMSTILWFVFFVVIMVGVLGGMFTGLAISMVSMIDIGMAWFYFIMLSTVAIFLGAFGSIFNTFSMLYLGKDNDLLLSLPIRERDIIVSRLVSVYLLGLMYSATVAIPAIAVYLVHGGFDFVALLGGILWLFVISIIVLVISCLLGYVVAKASTKLKHKNIATVIIALIGFALYYVVCFKITDIIQTIVTNCLLYGEDIKEKAYAVYLFGAMATGDFLGMVIYVVASLILIYMTYVVLSRTFIKIATSTGVTVRVEYKEKAVKQKSAFGALLGKEFARFLGSANYMLNCGLGIILIPVAGIMLLVKADVVREVIEQLASGQSDLVAVIVIAILCYMASMNDMVAPSVALEGKSLWIVRSLPVPTIQVLRAKIWMHFLLTEIPVLFTSICACIALEMEPLEYAFVIIEPTIIVILFSLFGMFVGLQKKPNLNWTNESYPLKQSMAVMLALFIGWGYATVVVVLYLFVAQPIGILAYLGIITVVNLILIGLLEYWLYHKAVRLFEEL